MKRCLISRIELLEARMIPPQSHPWVFITCPMPDERLEGMKDGERLVLDYFRHEGMLVSASERITADPHDQGKRCEPGGFLEDVIRDLHQDCYFRERGGSCRTCENTPVANT